MKRGTITVECEGEKYQYSFCIGSGKDPLHIKTATWWDVVNKCGKDLLRMNKHFANNKYLHKGRGK